MTTRTDAYEHRLEEVRGETATACMMALAMVQAIRDGGGRADYESAVSCCELLAMMQCWSARQWAEVAMHLAVLAGQALAGRLGPDAAVDLMEAQVALALDPVRFRAVLAGGRHRRGWFVSRRPKAKKGGRRPPGALGAQPSPMCSRGSTARRSSSIPR